MVLIPKKHRIEVYKHLFEDGVICVKDAPNAPHHHELKKIPNIHVMLLLRSLTSRALTTRRYSWRWHYYFLTNEGVMYLREFLGNIPENVVPKTHLKQQSRPQTGRPDSEGRAEGRGRNEGGRRREGDEYRRGPPREGGRGFQKEGGAPGGDVQPQFRGTGRGGFGRGRGSAPRE